MWPTDYYLAGHSLKDRQFVEPDNETLYDIIPEVGLVFKVMDKYYKVVSVRQWRDDMYTGYVEEVSADEWRKYDIRTTFGKNPDVEPSKCGKIDGIQLELF
jgi:hypothetical protein